MAAYGESGSIIMAWHQWRQRKKIALYQHHAFSSECDMLAAISIWQWQNSNGVAMAWQKMAK